MLWWTSFLRKIFPFWTQFLSERKTYDNNMNWWASSNFSHSSMRNINPNNDDSSRISVSAHKHTIDFPLRFDANNNNKKKTGLKIVTQQFLKQTARSITKFTNVLRIHKYATLCIDTYLHRTNVTTKWQRTEQKKKLAIIFLANDHV